MGMIHTSYTYVCEKQKIIEIERNKINMHAQHADRVAFSYFTQSLIITDDSMTQWFI